MSGKQRDQLWSVFEQVWAKIHRRGLVTWPSVFSQIGVFVRTTLQLERAKRAVEAAGGTATELTGDVDVAPGHVAVSTMHLANGLEFRAVVVMACDDEILSLQERIERISEFSDLEDVYQTERHLLYVACTRARDHLLVTGVDPASEFLDDLL
jgi:superfamily I DNA/RNA helicase